MGETGQRQGRVGWLVAVAIVAPGCGSCQGQHDGRAASTSQASASAPSSAAVGGPAASGQAVGEVQRPSEPSGPTVRNAPPRRPSSPPKPETLELPEGFAASVYAADVPNARSLAIGKGGTVFVSTRRDHRVYALVDGDGDHRAERTLTIASGLETPNGIALHEGDLYVAEIERILRYDDIEDHLEAPPEPVVVVDDLPDERHHGWRYIGFGPDGWLYVPIGAPCNVCKRDEEIFASIMRMKPDGSQREVYAHGIRNTVGFDWHPQTGVLWFTDNGRDELGDDLPPDELNRAPKPGMHFGFPHCHAGNIVDPQYGDERGCDDFTPPMQKLGPHVAALGMELYDAEMFPPEYRGDVFIAEHGSWNRSHKIGYRVTRVHLEGKGASVKATRYEPFATGWLDGEEVWGRPVDLAILADGSMLVSDDFQGAVYRIAYGR